MAKNFSHKNIWKHAKDDTNIIYTGVSIITSIGTVVAAIVSFVLGIGPWWQILITASALVANTWAFVMFFGHIRRLREQLQTKQIPVFFVTERPQEEAQHAFEELKTKISDLTGFRDFNKMEGFESRWHCLMPYERGHLPPDTEKWEAYISEGLCGIRSFANSQSGDKIYHVAIYGPSTLGLALGVAFGTKHPLVYYQHTKGQYLPVLDLRQDPRLVKERLPENYSYRYFKMTAPSTYAKDVAVVLGGASHEAPSMVRSYLKEHNLDMPMVIVDNTFGGNLGEPDWIPPVRELISIIHNLFNTEGIVQLHLFYAMPVAFGFGMGMALGHFVNVKVYNFESAKSTYYPIFNLNELRKLVNSF